MGQQVQVQEEYFEQEQLTLQIGEILEMYPSVSQHPHALPAKNYESVGLLQSLLLAPCRPCRSGTEVVASSSQSQSLMNLSVVLQTIVDAVP